MLPGLQSGLSALQAAQAGMDVVAQNLANANTPDYHRQVVDLRDRLPIRQGGLWFGTGVDVAAVRRLQDSIVQQQLVRGTAHIASRSAQLQIAGQLEEIVALGPQSLHVRVQSFFDSLVALSADPSDLALRRQATNAAAAITQEVQRISNELERMQRAIQHEAAAVTEQANSLASEIARLNQQIREARQQRLEPNDLLDRRDQLISQLAELVDVQLNEHEDVVSGANGAWLIGSRTPAPLQLAQDSDGLLSLRTTGFAEDFLPTGGRLAGLIAAHDQLIPGFRQQLTDFVTGLTQAVDDQYATGIPPGTHGFTNLVGSRKLPNSTTPLEQLDLPFPVQRGTLYVGITDLATGERTVSEIEIDPSTQSLADVAAALSAIDHLQAVVVPQSDTLQILAEPGFNFDFTGRPTTLPVSAAWTGTATMRVEGVYQANGNDELTFTATSSGQVGVTAGLQIEVRNTAGEIVGTFDIGQGYSPGSLLELDNGLSVRFASGSVVSGDELQVAAIADPDSSGLLAALGINTLFAGTTSHDFALNSQLGSHPEQFATTISGEVGDTTQLARLFGLRDKILSDSGRNLEQIASDVVVYPGTLVRQLEDEQEQLALLQQHLEARRSSLSGVDPNEELVRMLQFQRHFQAGAQVLRTIHETTAELLQIIG